MQQVGNFLTDRDLKSVLFLFWVRVCVCICACDCLLVCVWVIVCVFFCALMWKVLTVVCVWVFVCVGVRLLGEWYNVFSRVVMFSVCTCFSCVRVCTPTPTILHPIPAPASAPIPTPEAHHTSVMSYHVTSHALQGQHTHRHTTTTTTHNT